MQKRPIIFNTILLLLLNFKLFSLAWGQSIPSAIITLPSDSNKLKALYSSHFGKETYTTRPFFQFSAGAEWHRSTSRWQSKIKGLLIYSQFPGFTHNFVYQNQILPGIGVPLTENVFSYLEIMQKYHITPWLELEGGLGKHHLGDGYRSLIQSNHASPNLYFQVNARLHKNIHYESQFHRYVNDNTIKNDPFTRIKYVAFHHVKARFFNKIHLSLVEMVIWGAKDTLNKRNFDFHYLNPVIFYRPVEYSTGSSDNVLLAAQGKWDVYKKNYLYGQFLLDEFLLSEYKNNQAWWANKYAIQAGIYLGFDYKKTSWNLRLEHNRARPYTYAHLRNVESYSHFGQSLAHPLGSNYKESLAILQFESARHRLAIKVVSSVKGLDSNQVSYGGNILQSYALRPSDYGVYLNQGLSQKLQHASLKYAFLLVPKHHLFLCTQFTYRNIAFNPTNTAYTPDKNLLISIGLQNFFWNTNDDFY